MQNLSSKTPAIRKPRTGNARCGRLLLALALLAPLLPAGRAAAQAYPAKPVRIVVPFLAGGAVDVATRAVGQRLTEIWKQPVVVENRAGAGGNIGADAVAKAVPDGYTLLCTSNALALSSALYKKLPYDASRDFLPLVQLSSSYLVLVVDPRLPVGSVKDLIELARAKPGSLGYGSTGIGAAPHLVTEQFRGRAGVDMLHVPYKGDVQVTAAILAGDVQVAFLTPSSVLSQVRAGKMRALGVTRTTQANAFPGVPPVAATVPGFEYSGYLGVYGPIAMPKDIALQVQRDVARVLAMPALREQLAASGFEPPNTTPEQFGARYQRDIETFIRIVKEANIPRQD